MSQSSDLSKAVCAALERPGAEDRWYYLIYRKDSNGKAQIQIPATSHPWFTNALLDCAAQGFIPEGWAPDVAEFLQNIPGDWVPPDLPEGSSLGDVLAQAEGFVIQNKLPYYIPSADTIDVGRRVVWLNLPRFEDRNGDLFIRLTVTLDGEILDKSLLYSSDAALGWLVMESLEDALEVRELGEGPGPFIDLLTLRVQDGELATLIQTHHSKPGE